MESLVDTIGVSQGVAIAIVLLGTVQVITQILALFNLSRRPAVNGGKKWVWALVIILGNLLGAILYFAIGRQAPPHDDAQPLPDVSARDRASATADLLYGDRNSTDGPRP